MANYRASHEILSASWRRYQSGSSALSLRSLAKQMKISSSYLSKVLSGKAKVPKALLTTLPKLLEMDRTTHRQFMNALSREALRNTLGSKTPSTTSSPGRSTNTNAIDAYELGLIEAEWLLGRWYRTALLDLTTVANFTSDPEWISKRLGISKVEVETSIRYLADAGLLTINEQGHLKKTHLHLRFPSTTSKKTFRQHHVAQLRRAIDQLETKVTPKDFQQRLMVGVTVACNPKKLEDVKASLLAAVYEAAQSLSGGDCEEVYQINLQLFPQTKKA